LFGIIALMGQPDRLLARIIQRLDRFCVASADFV
jgi:hypothetical protein